MRSHGRRIALYSPGMVGLGHLRRNLLVAQALARAPRRPAILLLAEAREAGAFAMPPGADCLALPALRKEFDGRHGARHLDIALEELVELRAQAIRAALRAFAPDVLIVDHLPRGAMGELEPALADLRARGGARLVLGLRDVLGDADTVRREWREAGNDEAIRAYYDAVWVYGDPAVYDAVREYRFAPDVAAKVRYTGYLDQQARLDLAAGDEDGGGAYPLDANLAEPGRLALCLVGGGQDGARLAEAFAGAELPAGWVGVIVTGPFMPAEVRGDLHRRAALRPELRVVEFHQEPALLVRRADRVVAMGGYNAVAEVLSFEKRALIVPRAYHRLEQIIRAERLRDLGLIDMLHPDEVSAGALSAWLARDDLDAPTGVRERIDLNGLTRLPHLLEDVLVGRRAAALEAVS